MTSSSYIGVNTSNYTDDEVTSYDYDNDLDKTELAQSFVAQTDKIDSIELNIYNENNSIVTIEIREIASREDEATDTVSYGDTIFTLENIHLSETDHSQYKIDNMDLTLREGTSYAIVVVNIEGDFKWEYRDEEAANYVYSYYGEDSEAIPLDNNDNQGMIIGGEGDSNNGELIDYQDFGVKIGFASSEVPIFESGG